MNNFVSAVRRFAQDEEGITAIEYGLIAALMASAITAGFLILSPAISGLLSQLAAKLTLTAPTSGT